jgi:hypothetical protein
LSLPYYPVNKISHKVGNPIPTNPTKPHSKFEAYPKARITNNPLFRIEAHSEAETEATPYSILEANPEAKSKIHPDSKRKNLPLRQIEAHSKPNRTEANPYSRIKAYSKSETKPYFNSRIALPYRKQSSVAI